jgi:hypothetical protein
MAAHGNTVVKTGDVQELQRSIITIATGKSSYFRMAMTMARSALISNPSLPVFVVTDLDEPVPSNLPNVSLVRFLPGELPTGFSAKLQLDRLVMTASSLYIDADCLLLKSLDPLFDAFGDRAVGVLGFEETVGEWFGDTPTIITRLGIPCRSIFNGGVYFIKKGAESAAVFSQAREYETRYDEIGFVRLRGQPNEEPLISAALAKSEISPVLNSGQYYADFQWWPKLLSLNISQGTAILENPSPPDARHQARFPATCADPIVLHFLGHHIDSPTYRFASCAVYLKSIGIPLSEIMARVYCAPLFCREFLRNILRPLFRRIFGLRGVRDSGSRLILPDPPNN